MQTKQSLNPQLKEIKIQLDAASQKAGSIVNNLSFEQLKQRPQSDKWSIAECLVHLNLASQSYINLLNTSYGQIPMKQIYVEKQFRMDLLGKFLKWTLEPPPMSIFKVKTTEKFDSVLIAWCYTYVSLKNDPF